MRLVMVAPTDKLAGILTKGDGARSERVGSANELVGARAANHSVQGVATTVAVTSRPPQKERVQPRGLHLKCPVEPSHREAADAVDGTVRVTVVWQYLREAACEGVDRTASRGALSDHHPALRICPLRRSVRGQSDVVHVVRGQADDGALDDWA